MFPAEFASQFAVGAVAGIGQSFGHRLIPWVVQSWRWLTGSPPQPPGTLIRQVSIGEVAKTGIPTGHRLYQKQGTEYREVTAAELSAATPPNEPLWLFLAGDVWQPTRFAANDAVGQAEIGIELSPEAGFHAILPPGGTFDRHWLSAFLQGTFAGIVNSLGRDVQTGFLQGDARAIAACSEKLDQSLRPSGVRCRGIRGVTTSLTSGLAMTPGTDEAREAHLNDLATELAEVKTPQDWNRMVDGLKAAGVPVDLSTAEKLAAMQNQVLDRQLPPTEGVRQLAELTADAFARAGIEEPDLQRWHLISRTLGDIPAEGKESDADAPASVSVAVSKRPSTWFVWSRDEVDRRQLLFTRRTVKNCRTACEQGLLHLREMSALRDVRGLKEQLTLIEDLLATVPPLNPSRSAMRVEKEVARSLVAAYADAVKTTDQLATQIDRLLKADPTSSTWDTELQGCRESSSKLAQMVRDRRAIR